MVAGSFLAKTQVEAPSSINFSLPTPLSNFSDQVIKTINFRRQEEKLTELTINENLNKVAKARLAVIVVFDDYEGSASAMTREKALSLVEHDSSFVGDLFFTIKSEADNYMEKLLDNEIEKETILQPKFTEVGIAEFNTESRSYYYLIFSDKQKKVSVTVAPKQSSLAKVTWGGPELWEKVNKKRVEFGVGQLIRKDELCTIASIRLNQLLELKKLDGHAGFQPTLDRSDLKWIGEKYNISEYLAQGYATPEETVKGWENTLGHRSLLTGGEFVWGCIYAQNSFAVAISAY